MSIDREVIAITGAGGGIGRALSERFVADGFRVAACDLSAPADGSADLTVAADVTDPDAVDAFVACIVDRFGRLDAMIANAGIARRGTVEGAAWDDIAAVVEVDLYGVLHTLRAALRPMREQGSGRLVVVGSREAEICPPGLVGYSAAKAAVFAAVRTLAHELEGSDILVNVLIPGPTATAMNPRGTRQPDASYPTAKHLVTLPAHGPSGRTYFDLAEYDVWAHFADDPWLALRERLGGS